MEDTSVAPPVKEAVKCRARCHGPSCDVDVIVDPLPKFSQSIRVGISRQIDSTRACLRQFRQHGKLGMSPERRRPDGDGQAHAPARDALQHAER